ncbi:MAG: hypothetical protein U5L00_15115 [Desulfovermiculus sp.]|nr:hypothetical protein [Desulfovermiculus sp.]
MDNRKYEHRLIDLGLSSADRTAIDEILQEIGGHREVVLSVSDCLQLLERADCCLSLIIDIDAVPADDNLIRRIGKLKPHCKILILSNRTFHPELKESLRRNIFAVVSKSSTHDELRTCLQALLESSQIYGYLGTSREK